MEKPAPGKATKGDSGGTLQRLAPLQTQLARQPPGPASPSLPAPPDNNATLKVKHFSAPLDFRAKELHLKFPPAHKP